MAFPHILTPTSLTVMIDGKPISILKDNENFNNAIDALKIQDWDRLVILMNKAQAVVSFGAGRITVENSTILFEGKPIEEDKIVIVKINPKDVVSVPDYDTRKLRCCKYKVIDEYSGVIELDKDLPSSVYYVLVPAEDRETMWAILNKCYDPEDELDDDDEEYKLCSWCGEEHSPEDICRKNNGRLPF